MARLRIRVELNRGGVGVPLQKLARVVDEAQRFFHMLAEDVRVDEKTGEWLGFDFDHESLNFTAEFVGPATDDQVRAFNAAFDGTTPLRRATISQFARITDAIEEDEVIGFGLYQTDEGTEPSDWRALSRRDALRITQEIRVLAEAAKAGGPRSGAERDSWLPAVANAETGERIFSERRERSTEVRKWVSFIREVEANLSKRIDRVENEIEDHAGLINDLHEKTNTTEDSIRNLVTAVDKFCAEATRQVEAMSRPGPPASLAPPPSESQPAAGFRLKGFRLKWPAAASVGVLIVAMIVGGILWRSRSVESSNRLVQVPPAATSRPTPIGPPPAHVVPPSAPAAKAAARPTRNHLDIEVSEPTWVSLTGPDGTKLLSRLFIPGEVRSLEVASGTTLRTGNAGGLTLRFNGNAVGRLGLHGQVKDIHFRDGAYSIGGP